MNYNKNLKEIIKKSNGIILTRDVESAGIPRQYLTILVKSGELEHIAQGVYLTTDTFIDEMYCIQIRSNKIIFSNETALYLHDLTDRDPLVYTVTVPRGYSTNRLRKSGIIVLTVKKELYSIGVTNKKTIYGHNINVYDKERTICDIVKNRNKMDKNIFFIALKRYSISKGKNLKRLMEYAKYLQIEKQVKQYMEGLLV